MTSPESYVELDGSTLEGGGQLLRNAVALAALTHTPVRISNVRHGRPQPGLKAQHAAGLNLVTQITGARSTGIHKGSTTVSFDPTPGRIQLGDYEADPGTAGSTTLLFQVSLPCLLFPEPDPEANAEREEEEEHETERASRLTLRGGTNATNAPPIDYAQRVLLPFLTTHHLPSSSSSQPLTLITKQRGFFPHGGGLIRSHIPPLTRTTSLRPVTLTSRGTVTTLRGIIYASGKPAAKSVEEMRTGAARELARCPELTNIPLELEIETDPSGRPGSGLLLLATTTTSCTLSGSSLGAPRTPPSSVGESAARELVANLSTGGCVDGWMQDQMIVFLALARGHSAVRIGKGDVTLHTRTAMWVAERLTGAKFEVGENVDGEGMKEIRCVGIGLEGRL